VQGDGNIGKSDSTSSSVSGSHVTAKMMPSVFHAKHKIEKCASMRMGVCRADGGRGTLCGPIKLLLSQNERSPGVQAIIRHTSSESGIGMPACKGRASCLASRGVAPPPDATHWRGTPARVTQRRPMWRRLCRRSYSERLSGNKAFITEGLRSYA